MIQKNRAFPRAMDMLSDLALILLAYYCAVGLRFEVLDGVMSFPLTDLRGFLTALLYGLFVVFLCSCLNLYGFHRLVRRGAGIATVLAAGAGGILALAAVLFVLRLVDFSRWMLVFLWGFSSAFVIAKHEAVALVAARVARSGRRARHVAVVGNGHLAAQFIRDIAGAPELGIVVDGYISAVERPELGRRLGSYEQLDRILLTRPVDCLVVALEAHETRFMRDVLALAQSEGTRVELIPFYNDYLPTHPAIETVGSTKLINIRSTPLDSLGWAFAKRAADIVGALVILAATSPVMLAAAVGVRLSGPGPILFKQERVGKDKRPFQMLKFRSMRDDADHAAWTTGSDPRRTRFGRLIRKLSIDELPQVFNVLAGHMSLVGPRPELPQYVRRFKEDVPLYLVRQQVRPGMTGWAQIHGLRGDTSIEERVAYDIWYIENWSFGLDMRILLRTVLGGFINRESLAGKTDSERRAGP